MIRKGSGLFFGVLTVFVLSVFLGNSLAQKKKVPGVEKDKVYVGTSMPFSGPAAAWGIVGKAMEAYFQYVNEKKGGVHKRKIVLLARDDGYTPARMRANIEELHDKILLFAAPLGTANVSANRDLIAEKKVPTVAPLGNVRMWVDYPWEKLKYFFVAYSDYLGEAKELTKFAIDKLGSQKIAVFYQNDDYGETGLKGVEAVAQDKLVAKLSHELTDVDFSVHAQKIKDAGADTVIIYSNPRQTSAFVKKLSELGGKPKILASFPLADPVMVHLAGEAWDGAYVGGVIKLPQMYPQSKEIFDEIVKLNPELVKTPFLTLYGIFIGTFVEEALRRAGPEPTREKIIEVLENMENWESPVGFPMTFGKKRRHGVNIIGLWRVSKEGKYEQVMEPKFLDPLF